jgi:hypothetical protein
MLTIADRAKFINDGPFFDKYPDIYPDVTRYERTDMNGSIIESWERGNDGRMHETTKRDQLREQIIAEQEKLNKLEPKNND